MQDVLFHKNWFTQNIRTPLREALLYQMDFGRPSWKPKKNLIWLSVRLLSLYIFRLSRVNAVWIIHFNFYTHFSFFFFDFLLWKLSNLHERGSVDIKWPTTRLQQILPILFYHFCHHQLFFLLQLLEFFNVNLRHPVLSIISVIVTLNRNFSF